MAFLNGIPVRLEAVRGSEAAGSTEAVVATAAD
jgi:hypothetical protein